MNGDYEPSPEEILFTVKTPLGFSVRTTTDYWNLISTVKHPEMSDQLENVRRTLSDPDEVRASKGSSQVYLFYRKDGEKRWVCAVTKRLTTQGFLVTAYRTSAIKKGKVLWQK
ncbi:MAG: DUF4258 domain-containing protein [Cyanobacteria bacterium J06626_6]